MESAEAPLEISLLYRVKPGYWRQQGDKIDICFQDAPHTWIQIFCGIMGDLDVTKPIKLIVEAPLAKPSPTPV